MLFRVGGANVRLDAARTSVADGAGEIV